LVVLPRIVTIHDIHIHLRKTEPGASDPGVPLTLEATVKTYRYLDEEANE